MSTLTPRNSLIKPAYSDAADIEDINDNMDMIDDSIAQCNWAAASTPTQNDDAGDGYVVGSIWFDTTAHKLYICEDATVGAAVWRQYFQSGAAISTPYQITSTLADGTAPFVLTSKTVTSNLNADMVDGTHIANILTADGLTALTGDWTNAGKHISADHFISTVNTGTAPFSSTSTTLCTNVNADRLDSLESTAFAILAGQAGGQLLYGGTSKDETLTLEANSADASGAVKIPHGGLEIGTKATTATYGAINIHEGAAGAANAITFLDGDGSTAKATISKDGSDNLLMTAGGTSVYIGGSTGRLVFQAGMNGDLTFADTAYTSNFSMTQRPQVANSISTTYYGVYDAIFPEVDSGKTVTGSYKSYYTETMRNHNGAATDDDGTVGSLYGLQAIVGHYSSNASMAGTTTNVYACSLQNYGQKGTVTNMYGLYIADSARGGTITNEWSIYDASSALAYFTGTVSAGTVVDRTPGYDGDGIADIKKIKNKEGKLDHDTLPDFARQKVKKEGGIEEDGRDLGAMISILVKAVQQLSEENDTLKAQMADAIKRIEKLEKA